MRRARGFKEIQPKESIGYTEDQKQAMQSVAHLQEQQGIASTPQTLNHFGVKSEEKNYQDINGSKGISDVDGLNKAREQFGTQEGQEDLQRNDLSSVEGHITMNEIFPPVGIPPLKTSHHPSVPCAPVESDQMVDMNPFPYLFKSKYDFKFDTFKEKVLKDIKRSKMIVEQTGMETPEREGGYTSILLMGTEIDGNYWVPPHQWPELDNFVKTWLPTQVKKLWKEWNMSPHAIPYISESWTNEHSRGSFTEGHHHHNCQVALSCYLEVPKNSGRLMVKDPMDIYSHSRPLNYNHSPLGKSYRYIDVETNDVLFFPGFLEHQTERSEADDKRYILSININFADIGAHIALSERSIDPLWNPEPLKNKGILEQ